MTLDPVVITAINSTTRAAVYGASALIVGAALFDVVVLRRASGLNPGERRAIQARALQIADSVLRGNAAALYGLK